MAHALHEHELRPPGIEAAVSSPQAGRKSESSLPWLAILSQISLDLPLGGPVAQLQGQRIVEPIRKGPFGYP